MERQIDSGYYERYMLSQNPQSLALETAKKATGNIFLDNYVLDFLDVPDPMSEHDLQKSIIRNLKDFILEIGKDLLLLEKNIVFRWAIMISLLICCFITEDCLV